MTYTSSLQNIHKNGSFGDYENKNENELLKLKEIKNLIIYQIVKYKNSTIDVSKMNLDGLRLPDPLKVKYNSSTRILWMGPDNWLVISDKKNIFDTFKNDFTDKDFAITDLSHSRTIIEIEGNLAREVIKKGSPLNINELGEGDCSNSVFHAITITLDFISDNPQVIRVLALRSFGESLHHSLTDACLEFGFKSV
tara:strand:- start:606 stop:1190 length:585 start_codon:yes stop_codon:yes gene_type:complete